jgi:hypothetical protein
VFFFGLLFFHLSLTGGIQLIRLPDCAWCYTPYGEMPDVGPAPCFTNHYVTFACFNNLAKVCCARFLIVSVSICMPACSHTCEWCAARR